MTRLTHSRNVNSHHGNVTRRRQAQATTRHRLTSETARRLITLRTFRSRALPRRRRRIVNDSALNRVLLRLVEGLTDLNDLRSVLVESLSCCTTTTFRTVRFLLTARGLRILRTRLLNGLRIRSTYHYVRINVRKSSNGVVLSHLTSNTLRVILVQCPKGLSRSRQVVTCSRITTLPSHLVRRHLDSIGARRYP